MKAWLGVGIALWGMVVVCWGQEGTASLSGRVVSIVDEGLADSGVELRSEAAPGEVLRTKTDVMGTFQFSGLLAGKYTLQVRAFGFVPLTIRSVDVREGKQVRLPKLLLELGDLACGPPHAESIRLLPDSEKVGDLVGSVRGEGGQPVAGAVVRLMCSRTRVCAVGRSDGSGGFAFRGVQPDGYGLQVEHAGFYESTEFGYGVSAGVESTYSPIYLEACPRGNCDPKLRPQKPLGTCE